MNSARRSTSVKTIASLSAVLAVAFTCSSNSACAAPVRQVLSRNSSNIAFGVDSKSEALQMNGSLKDFSGNILIDPSNITAAQISFSATLSSATLPPHQMMQAILLQSVLARVENKRTSFTSSSIEHLSGKNYLVHGSYSWGRGFRNLSLPIEVTTANKVKTEIKIKAREQFRQQSTPAEFAAIVEGARGSSGWASARLIFTAAQHPS
jgi:polyisoprenoid-binding protein YceI